VRYSSLSRCALLCTALVPGSVATRASRATWPMAMWAGLLPDLALDDRQFRRESSGDFREFIDAGDDDDVVTVRYVVPTPNGPICKCARRICCCPPCLYVSQGAHAPNHHGCNRAADVSLRPRALDAQCHRGRLWTAVATKGASLHWCGTQCRAASSDMLTGIESTNAGEAGCRLLQLKSV
jgi:hypothetical protein